MSDEQIWKEHPPRVPGNWLLLERGRGNVLVGQCLKASEETKGEPGWWSLPTEPRYWQEPQLQAQFRFGPRVPSAEGLADYWHRAADMSREQPASCAGCAELQAKLARLEKEKAKLNEGYDKLEADVAELRQHGTVYYTGESAGTVLAELALGLALRFREAAMRYGEYRERQDHCPEGDAGERAFCESSLTTYRALLQELTAEWSALYACTGAGQRLAKDIEDQTRQATQQTGEVGVT